MIVGESTNFKDNGLNLMLRHGVEVIDLDEIKNLLREFVEHNTQERHRDISSDALE